MGDVFAVVLTLQGERLVRDYIDGLLTRHSLEHATTTIARQRKSLDEHRERLGELQVAPVAGEGLGEQHCDGRLADAALAARDADDLLDLGPAVILDGLALRA